MIDSARTRFDVDTILTVIQLAARYGLTTLHWHLTDDAGWRFPVPGYPKLESVAAHIPRNSFSHYDCIAGDSDTRAVQQQQRRWSDGMYTTEEISRVVSAADAAGIEIVPEVDLPGHMEAAIAAYPELGRPAESPLPQESMRESMFWAARNDLLWPTPAAQTFIETVIDTVVELFPHSTRVHIGGDECAYKQWTSDPWLVDWMAERSYDTPQQVQRWFFDIAHTRLAHHGRTVVAWDEIAEVTDADGLEVIAWDEQRGMERIAKTTSDVVFADARYLYFNRVNPDGPEDQKGMVPGIAVDDILFQPWPLTESGRCIGIEVCLWAEFILDGKDLMDMLLPRLLAAAERMWIPGPADPGAAARVAEEHRALASALTFDETSPGA